MIICIITIKCYHAVICMAQSKQDSNDMRCQTLCDLYWKLHIEHIYHYLEIYLNLFQIFLRKVVVFLNGIFALFQYFVIFVFSNFWYLRNFNVRKTHLGIQSTTLTCYH